MPCFLRVRVARARVYARLCTKQVSVRMDSLFATIHGTRAVRKHSITRAKTRLLTFLFGESAGGQFPINGTVLDQRHRHRSTAPSTSNGTVPSHLFLTSQETKWTVISRCATELPVALRPFSGSVFDLACVSIPSVQVLRTRHPSLHPSKDVLVVFICAA